MSVAIWLCEMSWRDKLDTYSTDVKYADSINWNQVQWTYLNFNNDAYWKRHIIKSWSYVIMRATWKTYIEYDEQMNERLSCVKYMQRMWYCKSWNIINLL